MYIQAKYLKEQFNKNKQMVKIGKNKQNISS